MTSTPDRRRARRGLATLAVAFALVATGCGSSATTSPDGAASSATEPADAADFRDTIQGLQRDDPLDVSGVTLPEVAEDATTTPFRFVAPTGDLLFVAFGYTNCPDVCPVFLTTFARAIEAIGTGPGSEAQLLFVGVDVQRDTPDQLKTFLSRINPTFIGLTGSEEVIAEANSAVFNPPIEIEEDTDGDGVYLVGHSSKVFPFTADGVGHRIYPSDVRQQQLVRDLPLLSEGTYR